MPAFVLTTLASLRILPVLQQLGDAYGFYTVPQKTIPTFLAVT